MSFHTVDILLTSSVSLELSEDAMEDVYKFLQADPFIESVDGAMNGSEVLSFLVGTEVLTQEEAGMKIVVVLEYHFGSNFTVL